MNVCDVIESVAGRVASCVAANRPLDEFEDTALGRIAIGKTLKECMHTGIGFVLVSGTAIVSFRRTQGRYRLVSSTKI